MVLRGENESLSLDDTTARRSRMMLLPIVATIHNRIAFLVGFSRCENRAAIQAKVSPARSILSFSLAFF